MLPVSSKTFSLLVTCKVLSPRDFGIWGEDGCPFGSVQGS